MNHKKRSYWYEIQSEALNVLGDSLTTTLQNDGQFVTEINNKDSFATDNYADVIQKCLDLWPDCEIDPLLIGIDPELCEQSIATVFLPSQDCGGEWWPHAEVVIRQN